MKALAWTRCAFAATVFGNISLSEATTISYTAFFLDERIGAAGSTGERLQIEAGVSDPFGVPSNISRVFATHSGTGSVVNLPYAGFGNFTSPTFSPYFATPLRSQLPFGARTGQFDISVQNSQGQTINARTQTLTATNPLTHARNITISGPSLSPTVSWSSISGADRYELRVWNAGGALIYDSPDSNTSLFNIPAGTLTAGSTYSLGIFSKDYDKFGSLERRSLTFKPLVADAPIKPTPLIPKDEELLLLATSANSTGPVGGFSEIANVRNVTDGYAGRAFIDRSGSQVVLAVAGTNDLVDWIGPNRTFLKPSGAPSQEFRDYVAAAAKQLEVLQRFYPNAEITLTGHSLGGAIVQVLGDAAKLKTITFDAPGAHQTISDAAIQESRRSVSREVRSGQIKNYRVYGDLVSTVGEKFDSTSTITFTSPISPWIVNNFPVATAKVMHRADILLERFYSDAAQTSEIGPTAASTVVSTMINVASCANGIIAACVSEIVNLGVTARETLFVDPGGGDGYKFSPAAGSPLIKTVTFPFVMESDLYFRLEARIGDEWEVLGDFQELETFDFGSRGVKEFRFFATGWDSALPVAILENFTFGVTFLTDGTLNATLTISSAVPEPKSFWLVSIALFGMASRLRQSRWASNTRTVDRAPGLDVDSNLATASAMVRAKYFSEERMDV